MKVQEEHYFFKATTTLKATPGETPHFFLLHFLTTLYFSHL